MLSFYCVMVALDLSEEKLLAPGLFKSSQVCRIQLEHSERDCACQKAALINLDLVTGRHYLRRTLTCFCFELVILICLGAFSSFVFKKLTRDKQRPFWDVLSHKKALSYCPPSLLNKPPVIRLLIHSGQGWDSFWSSYFSIFLLEFIELVVYKHNTVCHRQENNLKNKERGKKSVIHFRLFFFPFSSNKCLFFCGRDWYNTSSISKERLLYKLMENCYFIQQLADMILWQAALIKRASAGSSNSLGCYWSKLASWGF